MARVPLTGGTYEARSVIASAQRCLNLIPEPTPEQEGPRGSPGALAHYPTPGLRLLATLPTGPVRGIRQCTNGNVYAVGGGTVYALDSAWAATALGSINTGYTTPVSMVDNGLQMVIVDGTIDGWTVDIASQKFGALVNDQGIFRGADRVDYLDTFFLFNVPNTPQFMSSLSLSTTFDPLYFANKSAYSDLLVSVVVSKREIWLLGAKTTEVFYNSGKADFPFEAMPGAFVDNGCAAKYSPAEIDNAVFWLSQDRQGAGIVLKGEGLRAERISTFAIEYAISQYSTIADAIGWTYQAGGHTFYVLNFPTADATWVYDVSTKLWHERCWLDTNGVEHRHRGMCAALVNGLVVVGDWENGNIYALDNAVFTDIGQPIKRQRAFPHLVNDGNRAFYRQFIADMQTGTLAGTTDATAPTAYLDWSDDRGVSYGNPIAQSMGAAGEYRVSMQWQRLGMARDRVFRLTWSSETETALQGAWIDRTPAAS